MEFNTPSNAIMLQSDAQSGFRMGAWGIEAIQHPTTGIVSPFSPSCAKIISRIVADSDSLVLIISSSMLTVISGNIIIAS